MSHIFICQTVARSARIWYTLLMIAPNEIRIGSKYWFDFGGYSAFGTFSERDDDIITVSEALIYLTSNKNRMFFEERLIIDSRRLKDIRIDDSSPAEDHSDYYRDFNYSDKK